MYYHLDGSSSRVVSERVRVVKVLLGLLRESMLEHDTTKSALLLSTMAQTKSMYNLAVHRTLFLAQEVMPLLSQRNLQQFFEHSIERSMKSKVATRMLSLSLSLSLVLVSKSCIRRGSSHMIGDTYNDLVS